MRLRALCPVTLSLPFSVGDAVCTIAASTTFPEMWLTNQEFGRGRLGRVHTNFAGTRCSDHVAYLNAFGAWESARLVAVMVYNI